MWEPPVRTPAVRHQRSSGTPERRPTTGYSERIQAVSLRHRQYLWTGKYNPAVHELSLRKHTMAPAATSFTLPDVRRSPNSPPSNINWVVAIPEI